MKSRFFNCKFPHLSTARLVSCGLTLLLIVSVMAPVLAQNPARRVFTATPLSPHGDAITKTEKDSPADARLNPDVRSHQELKPRTVAVQSCATVAIAPGSSPAGGYLPLSLFGIPPIAGVGDDTVINFNVPAFNFASQTWTNLGVSSNGYVVIGGGSGPDNSINNQNFPNPTRPNNVLALFWTDLNPAAAGAIRIGTLTDGSDTWIVVDWQGVREFSKAGNLHSFQVWIGINSDAHPGEDVSYAYGPNTGNGDGGFMSVGAEDKFGLSGQNTYFNGTGTLPSNGTQLRVTTTGLPNTPPTLVYGDAFAPVGGSTTNSPTIATDNSSITGYAVQSQGTYTGTISVDTSGVVSFSGANPPGDHLITIRATDDCGATTDASFKLTVGCPTIIFSPGSLPGATVNVAYSQAITASPAGGNYTFVVTNGVLPAGLTLNSDGTFSGAPTQSGTFNFRVTATGFDVCTGFQDYVLTVTCPTTLLSPSALPDATVNTAYPQTITATPVGGNYSFALTSGLLPAGLTLNSNGSFSGAPTQSGTFNFRVTASGVGGCTGFRDYVLTVNCPTITLDATALPAGTIGTPYTQTRAASPAGTYNYAVTGGALPNGLSLNSSTGQISGTPTQSGAFTFTITAAQGGCSGSRSYSITIGCNAITLGSLSNPTAGVAYPGSVAASPAGNYTYAVTAGSMPSGLTLNPSTGAVTGLATVAGTYNFTIKADAGNGCSGSQTYTLTVGCPTITISPDSLPNGTVGAGYSQTLSATPATGSYSFAVSSGALPTGLSLNVTGVISGAPTANGTYSFTVTATGFGNCASAQKLYTIQVGSAGCPTITLSNIAGTGSVGSLYNQTITASPSGSYTYTMTSGAPPPGVTFYSAAALLYGYPTTAGTYNFTIQATDTSGCIGMKSYTITIP